MPSYDVTIESIQPVCHNNGQNYDCHCVLRLSCIDNKIHKPVHKLTVHETERLPDGVKLRQRVRDGIGLCLFGQALVALADTPIPFEEQD